MDVGADVSAADMHGQTPLDVAATKGHEAVTYLLMDMGADVSAADMHGQAPRRVAATGGRGAVARLPRSRGGTVAQLIAACAPTAPI